MNNIPNKALIKGLKLIQETGVDIESIFKVNKRFDPHAIQKLLNYYVESGRVVDIDSNKLKIDYLPSGLKVNKLNLNGNKTLKHLPNIEANLINAEGSSIESIEEGLKCNELDISYNKALKHLPAIQADVIRAYSTNIEFIEEGLKCGELDLEKNKTLEKLPKIEVKRTLWIGDTNIQNITEGLKCGTINLYNNRTLMHLPKIHAEIIYAQNTSIQTIGDGIECELLNISYNTKIKTLPKRLKVENLDLRWTLFSNYAEEKIRGMIKSTGGEVGKILLKEKLY